MRYERVMVLTPEEKNVGDVVMNGQYRIIQPLVRSEGWLCVSEEGGKEVVFVQFYEDRVFVEAEQALLDSDAVGVVS